MQLSNMTHPNGVKYVYDDGKHYVKRFGRWGWFNVRQPGVWIFYPDGVKRWIGNSFYDEPI